MDLMVIQATKRTRRLDLSNVVVVCCSAFPDVSEANVCGVLPTMLSGRCFPAKQKPTCPLHHLAPPNPQPWVSHGSSLYAG